MQLRRELPAYEQVKAWVRRHISSGDWKPGDPVPSEAALMPQRPACFAPALL